MKSTHIFVRIGFPPPMYFAPSEGSSSSVTTSRCIAAESAIMS